MTSNDRASGGLRFYDNGQVALSGELLELFHRLDGTFAAWARGERATDHRFPPILPARELEKIGYLSSFPHLATFPVTLADGEANLAAFASAERDPDAMRLTELSPVKDILTPAACYHFYIHYQRQALVEPLFLTTQATCFRREQSYVPLERLWSFSMREIVCIGRSDDVRAFLGRSRETVTAFAAKLGLDTRWAEATDPFFQPTQSAKYLAQVVDPVKHELVLANRLSLASINLHRTYFGEAFQIEIGGEPAWSGCVAFGLERWLAAIRATFGPEPAGWPALRRPDG